MPKCPRKNRVPNESFLRPPSQNSVQLGPIHQVRLRSYPCVTEDTRLDPYVGYYASAARQLRVDAQEFLLVLWRYPSESGRWVVWSDRRENGKITLVRVRVGHEPKNDLDVSSVYCCGTLLDTCFRADDDGRGNLPLRLARFSSSLPTSTPWRSPSVTQN